MGHHILGRALQLTCLGLLLAGSAASGAENPHPFGAPADCAPCHVDRPAGKVSGRFVPGMSLKDTGAVCASCHAGAETENPMLGRKPDFRVPADLPLDTGGRITCITCHSVHSQRYSDRRYTSESPLQVLLGAFSRKQYKTYYLRRPNANGELCRACHEE